MYHFGNEPERCWKHDNAFKAFFRMILPGRLKEEREDFFSHIRNRIAGVTLEKDSVIPYHGVREALGSETTETLVK